MHQWQCFYYKIIDRSPIDGATDQFFYKIDGCCRRRRCDQCWCRHSHRHRRPTIFQPVGSIEGCVEEERSKRKMVDGRLVNASVRPSERMNTHSYGMCAVFSVSTQPMAIGLVKCVSTLIPPKTVYWFYNYHLLPVFLHECFLPSEQLVAYHLFYCGWMMHRLHELQNLEQ